ncbi:SDR family NAD(P)-dependent oxidoreductase [Streptomyces shenzhenensis]
MTSVLDGKVAVVTGAASGIGAAVAAGLDAAGAVVIGIDLNEPAADRKAQFDQFIVGDVSDAQTWTAATAAAERHARWDILVNNAALQIEENILDTDPESFARVLDVNVIGAFRGIRAAVPTMSRGASIINIGSIMGFTADPLLGAYPASKAAVLNLTRTTALALGPRGIRVNAVCPGSVLTPLTTRILDLTDDPATAERRLTSLSPMNELCTVEEVAAIVTFLAGDASSGMNGSTLVADKGLTAANPEWVLSAEILNASAASTGGAAS